MRWRMEGRLGDVVGGVLEVSGDGWRGGSELGLDPVGDASVSVVGGIDS